MSRRIWMIPAMLFLLKTAHSADTVWLTNFDAAKEKAVKENKDLFLYFSESDGNVYCKKLQETVFAKKEFKDAANQYFVLVQLDFPRINKQSDEQKDHNLKLKMRYATPGKPIGFPTMILVDNKERAYARTGYGKESVEDFLKKFEVLRGKKKKRDDAVAEAHKAKGLEKAKKLDAVLEQLKADLNSYYGYEEEVNAIIESDSINEEGLKAKYYPVMISTYIEATRNFSKGIAQIDIFLKKHEIEGEAKQKLLYQKGTYLYQEDNYSEAIQALKEAEASAPETKLAALNIPRFIQNIRQVMRTQ